MVAFGNRNNGIILQREINIVIVFCHTFEDAVCAVLAIDTVFAIRSVRSRGLSYVSPSLAVIHREHPTAILYFQLRRNTVCTVFAIGTVSTVLAIDTILAVGSIGAIFPIFSICTILAVGTLRFHLISLFIGQPVAVESPVIHSISILSYADNRCVPAIHTVFNRSGRTIGKVDDITVRYLLHLGNRQMALKGIHDFLQRRDIGIHLLAEFL